MKANPNFQKRTVYACMLNITNRVTSESIRVITQLIQRLNVLSIFMHAGGAGVKLDDDIHLSWLGPESFSLLLGMSGSVPGNSFGVRPKYGMRFIAKISNVWAQTRGL